MSNPTYKSSRKYKCPYCDYKSTREELVVHVDKKHHDLIPENYTAARAIFDFINGKNHGICMICKTPVYEWNDKINRYYNLCKNPNCKATVRQNALSRHIKVYNKPTLLNDPEQQEKMLSNRKISGTYVFTDGTKTTYTGKYERNALEFMDKVLNIPGKDIQAPGPVLEYEYKGEKHKWITDIYYIPGNLLIEIKDGGSNPNNRPMQSYREKQIAKETMITSLGTFNYIRLTNNNFAQLLDILADMKNEALVSEEGKNKTKIHINEEVGGLPPHRPPEAYIIPYGMNNSFIGFAYTDTTIDKILISDEFDSVIPLVESKFRQTYECAPTLVYKGDNASEKINSIHEMIINDKIDDKNSFIESLIGRKIYKFQDIFLYEEFQYYDEERESKICKLLENGVLMGLNEGFEDTNVVKTIGVVKICHSPNGYYASTPKDFYMASEYFSDMDSLTASGIVDLMNNVYTKNSNMGGVGTNE